MSLFQLLVHTATACNVEAPLPQFHVGHGPGTGPRDPNALFQYMGVWHLMYQANWTDWAHIVSADLVRWTRLPSALAPRGDWDGTLTIIDGKPVILYDCNAVADCLPPSHPDGSPNDHSIVGVARPADYNDPNLTHWLKDPRNPIAILNGRPGAGPSNLWQVAGKINMLMAQGKHGPVARYETDDPSLHNWTVAQPYPFWSNTGGGVEIFHPLPRRVGAVGEDAPSDDAVGDEAVSEAAPQKKTVPTHMLGHVSAPPHAAGTPWFKLGRYHDAIGIFDPIADAPVSLDSSELVVFSAVSVTDSRMLHIAWFNGNGTSNTLTVPREISYEQSTRRLLALPVAELSTLRGAVLGSLGKPIAIPPNAQLSIFNGSAASRTFDLEVDVALPANGAALSFGVAVMAVAGSREDAEVLLIIDVSAAAASGAPRIVNMSSSVSGALPKAYPFTFYNSSVSFPLPASEERFTLRVLADNSIVEAFAADGRGVITTPVAAPGKRPHRATVTVFAMADAAVTLHAATAWTMGCGWAG